MSCFQVSSFAFSSQCSSKKAWFEKAISAFLLLAFVAIPADSYAQSLTYVSPDDKSLSLMRIIFGNVVNVIIGDSGPATPDAMLGTLSEVLNGGMVLFTGLIVAYTAINGILNSAYEGKPLGQAYNTMWVPLRIGFAVLLVLPFAGGYSLMQMGVIWMAGHGVGLANSTWGAALDHIEGNGTLYPPPYVSIGRKVAEAMLTSRVCMHGINSADRYSNISDQPFEYFADYQSNDLAVSGQIEVENHYFSGFTVGQEYSGTLSRTQALGLYALEKLNLFSGGVPRYYPPRVCGAFTFEFPPVDDSIPNGGMISEEFQGEIIDAFATLDLRTDVIARALIDNLKDPSTNPTPSLDALQNAVNEFDDSYVAALNTSMTQIAQARIDSYNGGNPSISGALGGARENGWISAGAWYWEFQRINAASQDMVRVEPQIQGPAEDALGHDDWNTIVEVLNNYKDDMLVLDDKGRLVSGSEERAGREYNFTEPVILGAKGLMDAALTNPDPVSSMADIGHFIIVALETAWLLKTTVEAPVFVADSVADTKGGISGGIARGVSSSLIYALSQAGVLLVSAVFLIGPVAVLLAFYLPATPMILWIMGVAGWFVLLIEAVIAAPIWAASHALPEGNGFVGQRALAGYMVLLSLFLRPTLMLFGFFSSMLLMIVMGKVVSFLFIPSMLSMTSENVKGIVTFGAMLIIFTMMMIQIAHRCYGLIHEVPDKVLRYIGGGGEQLGEKSEEASNRSAFIGAIKKGESHVAGGLGGGGGSMNTGTTNQRNQMPQNSIGGKVASKLNKQLR